MSSWCGGEANHEKVGLWPCSSITGMILYASNIDVKDVACPYLPLRPSGIPCFVPILSFVDPFQQSGLHFHQLLALTTTMQRQCDEFCAFNLFRISDPPRHLTPYDQRRNEYPFNYRRLPSHRIVCVPPEFVLLLV
jgi:hypothetical protein